MSISAQIDRIKANIASAYEKAAEKGAALPEARNSENLPAVIEAIPAGGLPEDVYTISVEASDPAGGSVSGGGTASAGMTVTVRAEAANGYAFKGWLENGEAVSADGDYTFPVSGDRRLVASVEVAEVSRLPTGYTELEYIVSNGYQYIDSGIVPNVNLKTIMDIELLKTSTEIKNESQSYDSQFFVYSYTKQTIGSKTYIFYYEVFDWNGNIYAGIGGYLTYRPEGVNGVISNPIKERTQVTMDAKNKIVSINGETKSLSCDSFSFASNMPNIQLFGQASSKGYNWGLSAKIYSCQMYNGELLIKDFVPCTNPAGVAGMYDLIGEKFYASSSSTQFTSGPAL